VASPAGAASRTFFSSSLNLLKGPLKPEHYCPSSILGCGWAGRQGFGLTLLRTTAYQGHASKGRLDDSQSLPRIYSPTVAAAFSRSSLPQRIYRLTICTERCPVVAMTARSEAPAAAAEVAGRRCSLCRTDQDGEVARSPDRSGMFMGRTLHGTRGLLEGLHPPQESGGPTCQTPPRGAVISRSLRPIALAWTRSRCSLLP
jgi:hypothetical protein